MAIARSNVPSLESTGLPWGITGRSTVGSNPLHSDRYGKLFRQPSKIVGVRAQNGRADLGRSDDNMRIDNVRRIRLAKKSADLVCLLRHEGQNVAAAEEAPQLRLSGGTAHLGHDGGGRDGNGTDLESHPVIGPDLSVVALGCYQHPGVVDDAHAERG